MGWNLTTDLDEYIAAAGPFLAADPVANTVPLSVVETMRLHGTGVYGGEGPLLGWRRSADRGPDGPDGADGAADGPGEVRGVLLRTGTHPLLLSAMPEPAVRELAATLDGTGAAISEVIAPQDVAETFAAEWEHRSGLPARIAMRQRLHRLDRLAPPEPSPPGTARTARAADRELVHAWWTAFHAEVHSSGGLRPEVMDDRLAYGGIVLWEAGGRPVSMAGRNRTVAGVARVAPVYTPPEHRARHYGSAVTAAVTLAALDAGARDVVLFTDLANPTSNAIYRRLGYRPVGDVVHLHLGE